MEKIRAVFPDAVTFHTLSLGQVGACTIFVADLQLAWGSQCLGTGLYHAPFIIWIIFMILLVTL